jgi:hypothetical protein
VTVAIRAAVIGEARDKPFCAAKQSSTGIKETRGTMPVNPHSTGRGSVIDQASLSSSKEKEMDKKLSGLLGTVAAVAMCHASAAAPQAAGQPDPLEVHSYAELLNPIPNAVALLVADDSRKSEEAKIEPAQYVYHHHHHHHHHHRYWRGPVYPWWGRRYHHHHHHHHHHQYYR